MERLTSTEFLYGFDLLELNGDDLRGQLLERRKAKLERAAHRADRGVPLGAYRGRRRDHLQARQQDGP